MTARKYFVGDVFKTNSGTSVQIIEICPDKKQYVTVRWLDSFGYEAYVSSTNLSKGAIQNPFEKSVYGVGYLGPGEYLSGGRKTTLEYATWYGMFSRSYSALYKLKKTNIY